MELDAFSGVMLLSSFAVVRGFEVRFVKKGRAAADSRPCESAGKSKGMPSWRG